MRTTITIDDDLLSQLMQATRTANRSEAIRRAIEAYLRAVRRENFKKLAGSRLSDLDWKFMEARELDQLNSHE